MTIKNCPYCGNILLSPGDKFCLYCGAPQKKVRSKTAEFFLTLLKCAGYFAIYFGILFGVEFVHELLVISRIGGYIGAPGSEKYEEFYSLLSERYSEFGILAAILVLLTYFIIFAARRKKMVQEVRLYRTGTGNFLWLTVFGLSAQAVVSIILILIYTMYPALEQYSVSDDFDILLQNSDFLTQFLYIAIVTPLLEETVFRGLIYTRLKRVMPTWVAVILSAIVFGTAHGNFEQFSYAFLLGIVCAAAFERFDSLWASFAVHFAFNASSYFVWIIIPEGIVPSVAVLSLSAGVAVLSLAVIFFTNNKPEKADINYEAL